MKYRMLREALGCTCRSCLNEKYSLSLTSEDCMYLNYMHPCRVCGRMKNIVYSVRPLSRRKIWFAKAPQGSKAEENEKKSTKTP